MVNHHPLEPKQEPQAVAVLQPAVVSDTAEQHTEALAGAHTVAADTAAVAAETEYPHDDRVT